MRTTVRSVGVGILLMISAAHAVFADPILPILVSDQRFIVASAGVGGQQTHPTVVKTPSAPFSLFVEEATTTAADASVTASATATQRSSVDGMSFSVFGSSESSAASTSSSENSGFGTGRSTFEIEFDLAAPLRYALTGELAFPHSEIEGEDAIALGEAAVFLENEPCRVAFELSTASTPVLKASSPSPACCRPAGIDSLPRQARSRWRSAVDDRILDPPSISISR